MKNVMKKCLAMLITVAMLASMITFVTFDTVAEVAEPESISSASEFNSMKSNGYYRLTSDITVDATYTTSFTGTFDGNGYTVTVSAPMFKKLERATVKNLTVKGAVSSTSSSALVAPVALEATSVVVLENIVNEANVETAYRGAGILAQANTNTLLTIRNCVNKGDITHIQSTDGTISTMIGGILGYIQGNTLIMKDCINEGKVSAIKGCTGGVVGRVGRDSNNAAAYLFTIYNCLNIGEVYSGGDNGAGILGFVRGCTANVINCTNKGYIHGSAGNMAGIVGLGNVGTVDKVANSASADIVVKNCINEGTVETDNGKAAGILAYWWGGKDKADHTTSFQAIGNINSGSIIGGGYVSQIVAYTNSRSNVVKDNLAIGSVSQKTGTSNVYFSFYSFSSEPIPAGITGNKIIEGDGTEYYTYTATKDNLQNIIKMSDLTGTEGLKVITTADVPAALAALSGAGYQAPDNLPAPTVISTAAEFKAINSNPSGNYILNNDITISNSDRVTATFTGTFDGNGHVITINNGTGGILETICGAKVSNLIIRGNIKGSSHVGAVANNANGWLEFRNIINLADVWGTGSSKYIGGLIGQMNQDSFGSPTSYVLTEFINCVNYGYIHAGNGTPRIGGLVGNSARYNYPIFENCANYGKIDVSPDSGKTVSGTPYLGGISSDVFSGLFVNCYNSGNISSTVNAEGGGICGRAFPSTQSADQSVSFLSCTNDGDIVANSGHLGGILGENGMELAASGCTYKCIRAYFTYNKCQNNGNIHSNTNAYVAGIAGHGYGSGGSEYIRMYDSVNTGTVSADGTGAWVSQFCSYINSNSTIISNCVACGKVEFTANTNHAVFVGLSSQDGKTYKFSNISLIENDGTVMFSYADAEENASHRVALADKPDAISIKTAGECADHIAAIGDIGYIADYDVQSVNTKIAAIGEVEYNSTSKNKIDTARSAFDEIFGKTTAVIQLKALFAAIDRYAKLEADHIAVSSAVADINAIGTVTYDQASKSKIDTARASYDDLTDDQKAIVTAAELKVLTDAEAAYQKLVDDHAAASSAVADINAIGTVAYDAASKTKIDTARSSYDNLTKDQKDLVTAAELKVLTDAEAEYARLKKKYEDDFAAASSAIADINAIGVVAYDAASKGKIDTARASYDELTNDQKAFVSAAQLKVLTDAETEYERLVQKDIDDRAAASSAVADINAIGSVVYTDTCKNLIDTARTAYDALTKDQKAFVTAAELKVLTDAEDAYETLRLQALADAQKIADDKAAASSAVAVINAIGTVSYTQASKNKIDAARTAYDALTKDQKAYVSAAELKVLTDAESTYDNLKNKAKTDAAAAGDAVTKINAIGTVTYDSAVKGKIDTARAAYDALTLDQKILVSVAQYKVLTDAESTYAALKAQADAVGNVVDLINAIGAVDSSTECLTRILNARKYYDLLSPADKLLVPANVLQILTDAEANRIVPTPEYELREVSGTYAGQEIEYRSPLTFEAVTVNCTNIEWNVSGAEYVINPDGTITVSAPTGDYTVQFTASSLDGSPVISNAIDVKVKTTVFAKIAAFLNYIINLLLGRLLGK